MTRHLVEKITAAERAKGHKVAVDELVLEPGQVSTSAEPEGSTLGS